jgi:flagellar biosynthesis/type III secretory pathway chaperone
MMKLFFNLSELLEEEIKVLEVLRRILVRETKALTSHDFEMLNAAMKEKEIESLNLRFLEKKREETINAIAYQIDRPKEDVSISLLIGMTDESYAKILSDVWKRLDQVVENVKSLVRMNRGLMENSLCFVRDAVLLLERISERNPIYFRTGRINQKQLAGKVLHGSI